jgi:hypothetical protein
MRHRQCERSPFASGTLPDTRGDLDVMIVGALRDEILQRTSHELVGAFLIAVTGALIAGGLFALLRRRVSDSTTLVTSLSLLVGIGCMAVVVGYIRSEGMRPRGGDRPTHFGWPGALPRNNGWPIPRGPWNAFGGMPSTGTLMVRAADADSDQRLSPEEITRFIQNADVGDRGSAEAREIDRLVMKSLLPASATTGSPGWWWTPPAQKAAASRTPGAEPSK